MSVNQYGLERDIPDSVKRVVRQECGNGCVICGKLPYEYEHFDPPYKDACEHKAEGIALLCSSHHTDKSAGRLSVQTIKKRRSKPYNQGQSAIWTHHLTEDILFLDVGGNILHGHSVGLSINGTVIIGMKAPATSDGQWLLAGAFNDPYGTGTLQFCDNEVQIHRGSWDFTMEGTTLTVRSGPRKVVAQVSFRPSDNVISIDKLKMKLANGHNLLVGKEGIRIKGSQLNVELQRNISLKRSGKSIVLGDNQYPDVEFTTLAVNYSVLGNSKDWCN
ncbi:hypothetical protein [Leptolyngbya sp. NIES-2104]|uniref:hypothetical protein n=1 Tax=Leptolyngbya sp. NIES-2104 TaxID=1552121 RepID=UPI0006ECB40D|nr:hypothetical protein [Leptolyngbya sp. NIES-2104]GAP98592.1 hypothetical protein NIES2104_51470 [Leptolyngbya sp. NIES-2104]